MFKKEHLIVNSNDNSKTPQLTLVGKHIAKYALTKIHGQAKVNKKIHSGLRILTRVNRYRSKHQIMRYWYRWKFIHSQNCRVETNELPDEFSTVMNDTKKNVIRSKCGNVSKDLSQNSYLVEKENYSINKAKIRRKDIKNRKKLGNLSRYISSGERRPTPKNNFNAFIKDHNINDRDLIFANHTVKSSTNGKLIFFNLLGKNINEDRDFENSIDTSHVEIEEIECIMVSDDSMFNSCQTKEEHLQTVIQDVSHISRAKIESKSSL